ncbi:hypothetical protein BL253_19095 [Pseudofrankia asymbiotica]|uniref:Uncharacterized protein n=1 Tax=Pseudofrankia asymbiotica TaxID=1834516 RepID=A0A1V2I8R1_9ACTN|nr:hypothetical protein BL253_19095 [Pseudofrankia asymbiotica]
MVCGDHDPAVSGFREDLFFCLFRFHGLAIGDAGALATAEAIADHVVEALTANGSAAGPRSRAGRVPRLAPLKGAATAASTAALRRHARPVDASCGCS